MRCKYNIHRAIVKYEDFVNHHISEIKEGKKVAKPIISDEQLYLEKLMDLLSGDLGAELSSVILALRKALIREEAFYKLKRFLTLEDIFRFLCVSLGSNSGKLPV